MNYIFFIHSSVEKHLRLLQCLAITNNAAMNILEQVSLWYGGLYALEWYMWVLR